MIYIDPRVGSAHLVPIISELGVPCVLEPLEFGDVSFVGNGPDGPVRVGIEVKGGKGGSDFITSMQSGRLAGHQADGMQHYDRRYLIVEGIRPNANGVVWLPAGWRSGRVRPVFMTDIEKYLTGLEEFGLRVRWSRHPNETAQDIIKLYKFWSEDYDSHSSTNTVYVPPVFSLTPEDERLTRFRRVLVSLKAGVGVGRSKAVAQHFGSIKAMVDAEVDAWAGIEGVGKKTAGEVVRVVREDIGEPSTTSATKESTTARGSASGVSPGARRPRRRTPHSRGRQDARVGTGPTAQRRVRTAATGRRVPARN